MSRMEAFYDHDPRRLNDMGAAMIGAAGHILYVRRKPGSGACYSSPLRL
jgi:hypothetical protein